MGASRVLLPLVMVLLARPSAAFPSRFAGKVDGQDGAGNSCTRHPNKSGDLAFHTLGNLADQNISAIITEAATGKPVAELLCPGVTYTVALSFGSLGSGHHLLTSTYGTLSDSVCLGPSNPCKNRACPAAQSSSATNNLAMSCTLPDGSAATGVDNVIEVSWGNGMKVNGNKVTYKFGGTGCQPCGTPPGAPPPSPAPAPSPAPSPSPRPVPSARLVVRASNTKPVLGGTSITVDVRLVGYTAAAPDTGISANLNVIRIPATAAAALSCTPSTFNLVKQGSQFVVNPQTAPITCKTNAAGRARVRVALKTTPMLANATAVVIVSG